MISCEWGRQTAANLLLREVDVQFRTYPGVGHDMAPAEVQYVQFFLCVYVFTQNMHN